MASTIGAPSSGCLLYVTDKTIGTSFLVDSGVQLSLLPAREAECVNLCFKQEMVC